MSVISLILFVACGGARPLEQPSPPPKGMTHESDLAVQAAAAAQAEADDAAEADEAASTPDAPAEPTPDATAEPTPQADKPAPADPSEETSP